MARLPVAAMPLIRLELCKVEKHQLDLAHVKLGSKRHGYRVDDAKVHAHVPVPARLVRFVLGTEPVLEALDANVFIRHNVSKALRKIRHALKDKTVARNIEKPRRLEKVAPNQLFDDTTVLLHHGILHLLGQVRVVLVPLCIPALLAWELALQFEHATRSGGPLFEPLNYEKVGNCSLIVKLIDACHNRLGVCPPWHVPSSQIQKHGVHQLAIRGGLELALVLCPERVWKLVCTHTVVLAAVVIFIESYHPDDLFEVLDACLSVLVFAQSFPESIISDLIGNKEFDGSRNVPPLKAYDNHYQDKKYHEQTRRRSRKRVVPKVRTHREPHGEGQCTARTKELDRLGSLEEEDKRQDQHWGSAHETFQARNTSSPISYANDEGNHMAQKRHKSAQPSENSCLGNPMEALPESPRDCGGRYENRDQRIGNHPRPEDLVPSGNQHPCLK
mmetsp:Transcript_10402/g.25696  ORF Transcript_10402/g.25696 Transcript_10402/m.25696 type:complete len:445 (-) Transcript_10402:1364-2698(-)